MKKLYKYVLPWIIVFALSFSFVVANEGDACAHAEEMITENSMTETAENSQDEAGEVISEETLTESMEEIVITPEKIGLHAAYVAKEEIEFLGENPYGAVTIDRNVMHQKDTGDKILTASADIETYLITGQSVYYIAGEYLYRYHMASGITDIMCNAPDTTCYSLSVITNRIVYMWVDNPEYVEGLETQAPVIAIVYDDESKVCHWGGSERTNAMAIEQIRYIENREADRTQQADEVKVGIYTINGTPIPLANYPDGSNSDYPSGWYFNQNISESHMVQARAENPLLTDDVIKGMAKYPGDSACNHADGICTSKAYGGGTQCVGFANYVFEEIWEQSRIQTPAQSLNYTLTPSNVSGILAQFQSIPSGSYIWATSTASSAGHSFIYISCDANGITYYHGNDNQGNCHVSLAENISWASFAATHSTIHAVTHPCNSSHTFSAAIGYDSLQHSQTCSKCGVVVYGDHAFEISQYDGTYHSMQCSVCQMTMRVSHGYVNYSSNGDSGHTKTCSACGYSTTEGHSLGGYSYTSGSGHSRSCTTGCGYTVTEGHSITYTVTDGTNHTMNCSICGYSHTTAHAIYYQQYNASYHDKRCYGCGHVAYVSHSSWSYIHNGSSSSHTKRCVTCGYSTTASHTCAYTYTSTTHTYGCTLCSYAQAATGHVFTYGSWSSAGQGVKKRTVRCTVCGYSYIEYT